MSNDMLTWLLLTSQAYMSHKEREVRDLSVGLNSLIREHYPEFVKKYDPVQQGSED